MPYKRYEETTPLCFCPDDIHHLRQVQGNDYVFCQSKIFSSSRLSELWHFWNIEEENVKNAKIDNYQMVMRAFKITSFHKLKKKITKIAKLQKFKNWNKWKIEEENFKKIY